MTVEHALELMWISLFGLAAIVFFLGIMVLVLLFKVAKLEFERDEREQLHAGLEDFYSRVKDGVYYGDDGAAGRPSDSGIGGDEPLFPRSRPRV